MKKSDVQLSHHQGHHGDPMINVKNHLWVPDLIAKYREHDEFAAGFWAWLQSCWDDNDTGSFDAADEWARESCWEAAQELATEIWPPGAQLLPWRHRIDTSYTATNRTVYSAGRSGGWLVVDGLAPVEAWDAIALGRWARFEAGVREIADSNYPYGFIWNLHEHVWAPIATERAGAYPAPNYAGSAA